MSTPVVESDSRETTLHVRRRRPPVWETVTELSVRNLALALAIGLVVAALGAGVVLAGRPSYRSQAVLVIDNPIEIANAPSSESLLKLNALRAKYAALVPTKVIAGPVAARVHLPENEVQSSVSATLSTASLMMGVAASSDKPDRARAIAQATADELVSYVQAEHEANNVPPARRFRFTIIEAAHRGAKVAPSSQRALAVALILGGLAFVCAYVVLQLLAPRSRFGA